MLIYHCIHVLSYCATLLQLHPDWQNWIGLVKSLKLQVQFIYSSFKTILTWPTDSTKDGSHRVSQRMKWQSCSLHQSLLGPLHLCCVACCFVGILMVRVGVVSDSFANSCDLFPPLGLPCPNLIWGLVPSPIASCYACLLNCSILKGNGGAVGLGGRGEVGRNWGE